VPLGRPPVGHVFEGQADPVDTVAERSRVHDTGLALQCQRVAPMAQLAFNDDRRPDAQRHAGVDPYPGFTRINEFGGNGARPTRFRVRADANPLGNLRTLPQTLSLFRNQGAHTNDIGRLGSFR